MVSFSLVVPNMILQFQKQKVTSLSCILTVLLKGGIGTSEINHEVTVRSVHNVLAKHDKIKKASYLEKN